MKAWIQAAGLTLLAGTLFVAAPIAAAVIGPLLGVAAVIAILVVAFKEAKKA